MVYCLNGDSVIRTWCLSHGIPYCVDTQISPPYSESWREGISSQTFSESSQEHARVRNRQSQYVSRPHSHGNGDSTEVFGK